MKDYLEKRREELRKRDGGFTLMEMLIVVAIIAVLIAVAIPVFTTQLENSREATDKANIRSAYADLMTQYLVDFDETNTIDVESQQQVAGWQGDEDPILTYESNGQQSQYTIPGCTAADQTFTVGLTVEDDGTVVPNITVA